jgi:hypothetical protein
MREDDDDREQDQYNVYEYDNEGLVFKRYQPPSKPRTPTKPQHEKRLTPKYRRVDGSLYGSHMMKAGT